MSATNDAGKLLLTPKGEYNGSTTYEIMDAVSYITSTVKGIYVAKGTTTGNLPTDTTKWQLLIDLSTFITNAAVATSSAAGLVKPDGITDEVDALGVLTALGVAIKADIDSTAAAYGSAWLKAGSTTLTPSTKQIYRVTENGREYLYFWNGTSYAKITTEHIIVNAAGTEFAQRSKLKVTGASVVDDAQNDQTLLNFSGGGGGGSTIKVTTSESTLQGKNVTITDGTTTLTEAFNNLGVAIFEGVTLTGNLTISSSDGVETATRSISVPYFGNYETSLAFWAATINVTVSSSSLNGQTVYAKKNGVVKGYATIVNGAASITVPEAGTYSIEATLQWMTYTASVVVSAETTYSATLTTFSATINLTTPTAEFRGQSIAVTVDGTSITGTAFDNNGEATYTALKAGTYVFTLSYGGETYTATQVVTTETTYSVQIKMWTATIVCSTSSAALIGATLTVKKGGATIGTTTFDSNGDATFVVHEAGTYTLEAVDSGWTYSTEVAVSAETTYTAALNTFDATLSISTASPDLYGQTITIKKGATTIGTTTFSNSGTASYVVHETGTYTCEVTVSGQTYTGSATVSAQTSYNVAINIGVVYGFHIDGSESDPSSKITYLEDAVGMTPAHMDYTTGQFSYGSWEDAFFMPRPCMLKSDGTVDYYLDPDDLTKKADGVTASDVASTSYNGNAMVEWGQNGKKIWMKIVPSNDHLGADIYIADHQEDANYHDWPFHDSNGQSIDHFYTPIYNGSVINGKMRSLSGQAVSKSLTAAQEIAAAQQNNPSSDIMWNTELFSDIDLINKLLFLMAKSTDTQTAYGEGLHTGGSEAVNNGFTTGIHNNKGAFYGTNSGNVSSGSYGNAVKVFYMENWWGFQWRLYQGHVLDNGVQKVKCTYGTEDGSTASGYTVNGEPTCAGYKNTGATTLSGTSGNFIKYMHFTADGMFPCGALDGSSSTYYCDGCWYDNSAVRVACRGGHSGSGAKVGASYVTLVNTASSANWFLGAALSCKPFAA